MQNGFGMEDTNEYFIPINEVSKRLNIPAHTLRYWEKQFPTIIRPTTGAGGRRYYRNETVNRFQTIQDLLYNRGMTIAGVKKMIHNGEFLNTDTQVIEKTADKKTNLEFKSENKDNNQEITFAIDLLNQAYELLS